VDLGCGSIRSYQPHFCRAMALTGAKTFGVDVHEQGEHENFTGLKADILDLVLTNKLKAYLQEAEIEAVNILHMSYVSNSPEFKRAIRRQRTKTELFYEKFFEQGKEILTENGYLMINEPEDGYCRIFQMISGEYVLIYETE
jgi:hypothetical protein